MASHQQQQYNNQNDTEGVSCACQGFCGCTSPNAGLGVIIALQLLLAAPALIAAGVLMEGYDAGALNIANGVIFALISLVMILALLPITTDRHFSNVMIWAALLLHTLMIILCGGGIGWNAYNATLDWGWDCYDCNYGVGACIGGGANLIFFLFSFHFICVDNGWRIQNLNKHKAREQHNHNAAHPHQFHQQQANAAMDPQVAPARRSLTGSAPTSPTAQQVEMAPQVSVAPPHNDNDTVVSGAQV